MGDMIKKTVKGGLSYKPQQLSKKLLKVLQPRAQEVLERRYGLNKEARTTTLEAIGRDYGITRERVRQIEKYAIANIRKSEHFKKEAESFVELANFIEELGGVVAERELLDSLAKDDSAKQSLHFLLVLGEPFAYLKETPQYHSRWSVNVDFATQIEEALDAIYNELDDATLISEKELFEQLKSHAAVDDCTEDVAERWLSLSKRVGKNPLGEWGRAQSPNVHAKGMRDFAYLAIKQHGSPMHFREVAKVINELFGKKAHEATCHNELIKDARFVLVGRGLYALAEWGYSQGVVKDVIVEILKKHEALARKEIIDLVRKERYVKDNTIVVNLQDNSMFRRNSDGTYSLV